MKKALLIGINYVESPDISLQGCFDDVLNMRNVLIDAYDYRSTDIITLRDDDTNTSNLPTKKNILAKLEQLVETSSDLEEIWFHYSGHGTQVADSKSTFVRDNHVSATDDVLVPSDYNEQGFIHDMELFSLIQKIQCRAILIFDCCHSGTICDLPWSFLYQSPTSYRIEKNTVLPISNTNIYVFSGCRDDQTSADTYNALDRQMSGAFTTSFITCLRNSHHNIPIINLYRDVCMDLLQHGFQQTPKLTSSNASPNYVIAKPGISAKINLPIGYAKTKTSIVKSMNLMLGR
jgi:metacaspase-1